MRGCVYTTGGGETTVFTVSEYQVLTGTGFTWASEVGNKNPPANALLAGKGGLGNMYVGRCNTHNSAFLGKISDRFYYNYQENEVADCNNEHDLLLC